MSLITGLDIGSTKVCAIIGEAEPDGSAIIVGFGVAPCRGLKRGVVVDMDETVPAIKSAVNRAQQMSGRTIESVYVGVTGEHIVSQNSTGIVAVPPSSTREITTADVDRVLEHSRLIVLPPDREIIHAIPRGFSIDGQNGIHHPVGMSGSRLEVETHIVTGRITFLQNIERCVQRAGLTVDETVLEPLASSASVLTDIEKEIGVALVDIGGGTTDVAVFTEGAIASSAIVPVGGQYVTLDINKLLRTTPEEAERLKIEYGCAMTADVGDDEVFNVSQIGSTSPRPLPKRVLAEIIEPRMTELFQMVRQHMERAGVYGLLPAGVVLTGGGSRLTGTVALAEKILGSVPVRIGVPVNVGGLRDTVEDPTYSTAVGLLVYGAKARAQRQLVKHGSIIVRLREGVSKLVGMRR